MILPSIDDNSTYRKYAPFLRRRDEQKAQTYDKWIYQQLSKNARVGGQHLHALRP
jgi:hypothetical protein